jgi:hypothetical protein
MLSMMTVLVVAVAVLEVPPLERVLRAPLGTTVAILAATAPASTTLVVAAAWDQQVPMARRERVLVALAVTD